MVNGNTTWQDLFQQYNINNKYTKIRGESEYECHNRVVVLGNYAKNISPKTEELAYLKISVWRAI